MKKFYFFIGTTAELIKLAPVIGAFEKSNVDFQIISSNQNSLHFSELNNFIKTQKADYVLKIRKFTWPKNIYLRFIVWFVKTVGNYFLYFRNVVKDNEKGATYFIVHGDTVSTLLGSLVAKVTGVSLVHIESGLRSYKLLEPFPEEINRVIVSRLADYHFCPNSWSKNNLKKINGKKINTHYNTVGETTLTTLKQKGSHGITELKGKKYFVFVLHRQEHTLFNKHNSEKLINQVINNANTNLVCVFVMHKLTKDYLKSQKMLDKITHNKNIILPSRLEYTKFVKLLADSEFVITDGGSNQEECYFMGKPCLIIREHTERVEGLGENAVIVGNNSKKIDTFFKEYKKYKRKKVKIDKDKSPSQIITDYLINI